MRRSICILEGVLFYSDLTQTNEIWLRWEMSFSCFSEGRGSEVNYFFGISPKTLECDYWKEFKFSVKRVFKLAFLCRHQHLLAVLIEAFQFLPTQLSSKRLPTNLNSTLIEYVIVHRYWCLQQFFRVSLQFLTSLKLGHCSKLNWPKRVSAVYWPL